MESTDEVLNRSWTRVAVSKTVDASPGRVWAEISNADRWLKWYRPLSEFEVLESSDLGLGATIAERQGPWKSTAEVTEWHPERAVGLALRSFNYRSLLSQHYRRIELSALSAPESSGAIKTTVTFTSGFAFGPVGWLMLPYSYPHMLADMYFEQRSVLKGLASVLDDATDGRQDD